MNLLAGVGAHQAILADEQLARALSALDVPSEIPAAKRAEMVETFARHGAKTLCVFESAARGEGPLTLGIDPLASPPEAAGLVSLCRARHSRRSAGRPCARGGGGWVQSCLRGRRACRGSFGRLMRRTGR